MPLLLGTCSGNDRPRTYEGCRSRQSKVHKLVLENRIGIPILQEHVEPLSNVVKSKSIFTGRSGLSSSGMYLLNVDRYGLLLSLK